MLKGGHMPDIVNMMVAVDGIKTFVGTDIYVFARPGQQKKFLGEAFAVAAAGTLLTAFLRGLTKSFEGQFEEWGKQVGDWLKGKLGDIFESEEGAVASPSSNPELQEEVKRATGYVKNADSAKTIRYADNTQAKLAEVLQKQGLTEKKARLIAEGIRKNAISGS
jgi:hypothetical protein